MKEFCTQKMVEMKIPRLLAKFRAMHVPRLERWKNNLAGFRIGSIG